MVSPIAILAELEQRSRRNAFGLPHQEEKPATWDGMAFRLGDRLFVAPLAQVREILPLPALTRVPNTQPWLRGVANVRGRLVTVVDLYEFLTGKSMTHGRRARILITETQGMTAGLIVREVLGMKHFVRDAYRAEVAPGVEWAETHLEGCYVQSGEDWHVFSLHEVMRRPAFTNPAARTERRLDSAGESHQRAGGGEKNK